MSKSWHNNDLALAPICHFHTLTACEFSFLSPLVCDSGFPLQQTGCYQVGIIIYIRRGNRIPVMYHFMARLLVINYPRPDRGREQTGEVQTRSASM